MSAPNLSEFTRVATRIGLLSFGGPAAQIALMQDELVDKRDWITQSDFLRALSFCMLLPGPEAMQLATYLGWRLHGVVGGLIGGTLFVLPGAAVIFGLAIAYVSYGELPIVSAAFLGVKACVVVIVIQALLKVSKRTLVGLVPWAIAFMSFIAIALVGIDYPIVVAVAACLGIVFLSQKSQGVGAGRSPKSTKGISSLLAILWIAPFVLFAGAKNTFFLKLTSVFSTLAVVTFGGAYAVLGYLSQTAVTDLGWISSDQMVDALGLAETTPGPLILVTQFVGFLAGFSKGGIALGLAAGLIALWVTFIPCFLWIFLFAPHLERLMAITWLANALAGITAAVVGVIASISLWFAIQIWFNQQIPIAFGPFDFDAPIWISYNMIALSLSGLAAFLLLWPKWDILWVLPFVAAVAVGFSFV